MPMDFNSSAPIKVQNNSTVLLGLVYRVVARRHIANDIEQLTRVSVYLVEFCMICLGVLYSIHTLGVDMLCQAEMIARQNV